MSLVTVIAASSQPAGGTPPEPSSVLVSGAGTSAVDGTYLPSGDNNGRPYYNLEGQPAIPTLSAIAWNGSNRWLMVDGDGNTMYRAISDVAFPWLGTWTVQDGDTPVPTVTEGA